MSVKEILEDFHKEKNRLDRIAISKPWHSRTMCIPFLSRDWTPLCARYGFKENKFLEISYVDEDGLKYIKC